jgi:hypothetical protein
MKETRKPALVVNHRPVHPLRPTRRLPPDSLPLLSLGSIPLPFTPRRTPRLVEVVNNDLDCRRATIRTARLPLSGESGGSGDVRDAPVVDDRSTTLLLQHARRPHLPPGAAHRLLHATLSTDRRLVLVLVCTRKLAETLAPSSENGSVPLLNLDLRLVDVRVLRVVARNSGALRAGGFGREEATDRAGFAGDASASRGTRSAAGRV